MKKPLINLLATACALCSCASSADMNGLNATGMNSNVNLFTLTGQAPANPLNTVNLNAVNFNTAKDDSHFFDPSKFDLSKSEVIIPELGGGASLLDQQQETQIGEMVLRQIGQEMPLYEDVWTQDEMYKIFGGIYANAGLGAPIGLVIIRDESINAFAVPGGLFAVNTGLISSAQTIDEIAGVVGHEIAHVSQRHYSRSKDAFKNQTWLTLGSMLASIVLASQSSDAAGAVALGAQAAMIDRQLAYSRNQEREADRVGMRLMYAAGYKPTAMADFFEIMDRKIGRVSFLPDFWLTHPLSAERMSEARLRAAQFPKPISQPDLAQEQKLHLMQYRIAVFSGQASESRLTSAAERDPAARLALASFYAQQGRYDAARKLASEFSTKGFDSQRFDKQVLGSKGLGAGEFNKSQPYSVIAAITQAEIELGANQPQKALDFVLPVYRVMPENRALAIYVARAFNALGKAQDALDILQPLTLKNPRDAVVWQMMEAAANRLPDNALKTLQVLRFRAENQFWRGNTDQAIRSLIRANSLANQNKSLQAKVASRLAEMQQARQFRP